MSESGLYLHYGGPHVSTDDSVNRWLTHEVCSLGDLCVGEDSYQSPQESQEV